MTIRTPSIERLLRSAIEYYLEDTHTCFPAKVIQYFSAEQRVEVQPLIKRRIETEDGELLEDLPVISDVPVAFPRTRKYFITFPLEVDDVVTIWCTEKSLDAFLSSNGRSPVDPDDFRMHELTDAIAYPGGYPFAAPVKDISSTTMAMGRDERGIQVHFKQDEIDIRLGGKAEKHVALAEDLENLWTQLKSYLDSHTHISASPMSPTSQPSSPSPGWDGGINSNVVAVPKNK